MYDWRPLARDLSRALSRHAPGWTDAHAHDPGITLLELMAYLAEKLSRDRGVVQGGEAAAARIAEALRLYRDGPPTAGGGVGVSPEGMVCWSGDRRPRYVAGQLLTADLLAQEQAYHVGSHRRHVRALHGSGVVSGLQVGWDASGVRVLVSSGYAIDGFGRDLVVRCPVAIAVPPDASSPLWLVLVYAERAVEPVPVVSGTNDGGEFAVEATSIEQGVRVLLAEMASEPAVAVARLVREAAGWRIDSAFEPARPR